VKTDPDCIFCKIVAGELPSARVLTTPDVVAFLDINPVATGHVLVVPTSHAERLADFEPDGLAAVARELPHLVAAVSRATETPACNVVINDGRTAGQIVPHVHVHLIPRTDADGLGPRWPHGQYTDEQMEQVRSGIEQALA
jgi:histidine triad (HIT) family protein